MIVENSWSAEGYQTNARFVSDLAGEVFAWLAPGPGERILDVGCGDGALTERIAAAGARVVGIDASSSMVEAARARGLDAHLGDAAELAFDGEFDAVFSNAALHWVRDAERAALGMARALVPGGRLVAEFGGHGNVAAIVTAMRAAARIHGGDESLAGPWFFPTPDEYSTLLGRVGFEVERCELAPRQTPLPTGLEGWLQTFRQPFFDQFAEPARTAVLEEVRTLLAPSLSDGEGRWSADYVRIRIAAHRPGKAV